MVLGLLPNWVKITSCSVERLAPSPWRIKQCRWCRIGNFETSERRMNWPFQTVFLCCVSTTATWFVARIQHTLRLTRPFQYDAMEVIVTACHCILSAVHLRRVVLLKAHGEAFNSWEPEPTLHATARALEVFLCLFRRTSSITYIP